MEPINYGQELCSLFYHMQNTDCSALGTHRPALGYCERGLFLMNFTKNNGKSLTSMGPGRPVVYLQQGTLPLIPEVCEGSSHF